MDCCYECKKSYKDVIPVVIKGCGHTFCSECVSGMVGVQEDWSYVHCYKCSQNTYFRPTVPDADPVVIDVALMLLVRENVAARCGDCGDFFGPTKDPYYTGIHQRRNYCGHSICLPCYESRIQQKALFCRGCCVPIKLPRRSYRPKKNLQLLRLATHFAQYNAPEAEEEEKRTTNKKAKNILIPVTSLINSYGCFILEEGEVFKAEGHSEEDNAFVEERMVVIRKLLDVLKQIWNLNETEGLGWADRITIIKTIPESLNPEEVLEWKCTEDYKDNANRLLKDLSRVGPYLNVKIDGLVPESP